MFCYSNSRSGVCSKLYSNTLAAARNTSLITEQQPDGAQRAVSCVCSVLAPAPEPGLRTSKGSHSRSSSWRIGSGGAASAHRCCRSSRSCPVS